MLDGLLRSLRLDLRATDTVVAAVTLEEVSLFRTRGLLADGYSNGDFSARLCDVSPITVAESLGKLRKGSRRLPTHDDASMSTLPVDRK